MSTMTISDLRTKRAHIGDQAKAFLDERRDTATGCPSSPSRTTTARAPIPQS